MPVSRICGSDVDKEVIMDEYMFILILVALILVALLGFIFGLVVGVKISRPYLTRL